MNLSCPHTALHGLPLCMSTDYVQHHICSASTHGAKHAHLYTATATACQLPESHHSIDATPEILSSFLQKGCQKPSVFPVLPWLCVRTWHAPPPQALCTHWHSRLYPGNVAQLHAASTHRRMLAVSKYCRVEYSLWLYGKSCNYLQHLNSSIGTVVGNEITHASKANGSGKKQKRQYLRWLPELSIIERRLMWN